MKDDCWGDKLYKEIEVFVYYRRIYIVNERRRRGEMRDFFEKLKIILGLFYFFKVFKSFIFNRVSIVGIIYIDISLIKRNLKIL